MLELSSRHRPWLFFFLFALTLRLLYLQGGLPGFELRQTPVYGDAAQYYMAAVALGGGDPAQVSVAVQSALPDARWDEAAAYDLMASRGPGYVAFLTAVFSLFGEGPGPVRYVQALLGALTCVFIGLVGRDLVGQRAGLIAAGLAAIHPSSIFFTGRMLTEVLAAFALWLGLYALVRGAQVRSPGGLVAAAAGLSAAALIRPTLLATLPFLLIAVVVMLQGLHWPRRLLFCAAFGVMLLGPVAGWSFVSRSLADGSPIAGTAGFETVSNVMQKATAPERRGWSTDKWRPERKQPLTERLLYSAPAGLNLIWYHLWYVDDLWREARPWMHALQRVIVVFALAGMGLALLRWRDFAPLLFCLATLALVSIKWIEIRPNLPFLPILFVLAGAFTDWLLDRTRVHRLVLAVGIIATPVLLYVSQLFQLAWLFPRASATSLGHASDAVVLGLALGWGALLWWVHSATTSRARRAIAAWVPALTFVLLFASYAYVRSEPRWRAWHAEVAELGNGVVQTVDLGTPVPAGRIESIVWLVDLETAGETPPLRVGLDGDWLAPDRYTWKRLFCRDDGSVRAGRWTVCEIYRDGVGGFTGAFRASPQWWGLELDASLVVGQSSLSLMLAWDGRADERARLGGTFSPSDTGRRIYGPSVHAYTLGSASSLYRWHVAHDWRMWETDSLRVGGSASRLERDDAQGPRSFRLDYIASMLQRGEANWNIRLRLETREGLQLFF